MRQTWEDYEKATERGPLSLAWKVIIGLVILFIGIWGISFILGWFGSTAEVVQKEFNAEAILKKYEWFKDVSAQLEKKKADIVVYDSRLTSIKIQYGESKRKDWTREDREQYNVWASEIAGIKASFNSLAAEYNSQMAKFNWRFANVGDLSEGASEPLPREYKTYIVE